MRLSVISKNILRRQLTLAGLYAVPMAAYAMALAWPAGGMFQTGGELNNGWVMVMITLGTTLIAHSALLLLAAGAKHLAHDLESRDGFLMTALCILLVGVPGCFIFSWLGFTVFSR